MSIGEYITKQRNSYSSELCNDMRYWSLSALSLSYFNAISPVVQKYVHGVTLDAGAGRLNGKMLLEPYCSEYVAMDIDDINGMIQIVGDVQAMVKVENNTFDTIYSSQVLEHVPRPLDALSEMHRVVKPGGFVIVSVPLFNSLHEEPHDYYRYTPYGLKYLMEQAGLTVVNESIAGGLFSFLSHVVSVGFNCFFWSVPLFRWVIWWINKVFIISPVLCLERISGISRKFPSCIIMVGRKSVA